MGLLAVVNLVAVLLLIKVGLRIVRDYDEQRRAGIAQPVFDPAKFADPEHRPRRLARGAAGAGRAGGGLRSARAGRACWRDIGEVFG